MSIYFYNEDVKLPDLEFDIIRKILKSEIRHSKLKLGDVNYIFCSDGFLLELNIKFLKHDYYTDVITFDYSSGDLVAGDVYISTDRVIKNSATFGQSISSELVRVISHGLLHLLKYNDKEEEEIVLMRSSEDRLIKKYLEFS